MYNRIGKKIKGMATVIFIIEAVAAVIVGIRLIPSVGLLIMLLGPVVAWISSWLLYGFGELIDKTCEIECNTRGGEKKSQVQNQADEERVNKIERLRSQGLITEEEYQEQRTEIISKL